MKSIGNMAFKSPHTCVDIAPTRRDDLFSVLFMLYYLHTNRFGFPKTLTLNEVAKYKKSNPIILKKAEFLQPFADCLYKLEFNEEPNYNYLGFIFKRNLMNKNLVPDK